MKEPQHVAIIMDGNGRWAQERRHNRVYGHVRGAKVARKIIEGCAQRGIKYLTLFTFSTENWNRPASEVALLMLLLRRQLKRELQTLLKNNIRFRVIGNMTSLPPEVRQVVEETVAATAHCTGMNLVFALSYGGRQEIKEAMQKIARRVAMGHLTPAQVDENCISEALESAFLPDPDLIIRSSGEFRISNFFLWQAAYSEIYITEKMWPEFTMADLEAAITAYSRRDRRFGRIAVAPEAVELSN